MSQEDEELDDEVQHILVQGPGGSVFEMKLPLPEAIAFRLANGELTEVKKPRPTPSSIPAKKLTRPQTVQRRR